MLCDIQDMTLTFFFLFEFFFFGCVGELGSVVFRELVYGVSCVR